MNNENSKKIAEYVSQIVDLEDDNDSLQKTRTCMQGYVRNEADKYKETRKTLDNVESYCLCSNAVYILVFLIHIISYMFTILNRNIFILHCTLSLIILVNIVRIVLSINSYKRYEQKMIVNNEYLDNLLDNI
jgi:hypothetical protein